MSLAHALLTALSERSCSGAELAKRFDRSIGFFWPATHQQIYRELSRLEAAGWVVPRAVEAAPGRRRAYEVLPAGRDELRRWVATPQEPKAIRDELLVKLRAEAVLAGGASRDALRLRLDRHRGKLEAYHDIERRSFSDAEQGREQRLQHLILKAGVDVELLWIRLCEEALAVLDADPD
jgi:DNA-binding PadR family transcriptional regulator